MVLHTMLFNKYLKVSFLYKHKTKYNKSESKYGFWHISRLGSLISLFYFNSITSASAPHIHQYLMSIRFENQNCKSKELQGIFYISYYWCMFHSHL